MRDPFTQRYAVASIKAASSPRPLGDRLAVVRRVFDRTGISDERRSEVRAGLAVAGSEQVSNRR